VEYFYFTATTTTSGSEAPSPTQGSSAGGKESAGMWLYCTYVCYDLTLST